MFAKNEQTRHYSTTEGWPKWPGADKFSQWEDLAVQFKQKEK